MTEENRVGVNPVLVELTKKMLSNLIIAWPPVVTDELRRNFQEQKHVLFRSLHDQGINVTEKYIMDYVRSELSKAYGESQSALYAFSRNEESFTIMTISDR